MTHPALPDLPRSARWLQEGNATWVEPIARAQAGQILVAEVWRQAVEGLPKGEPGRRDGGMDGTENWGRLYWGGAGFWLLAEIAVFEQRHGRFLLRDTLIAINHKSGGDMVIWSHEEMMVAGDRTAGATSLFDLYRTFADNAVQIDLSDTFSELGIAPGTRPNFDDSAILSGPRQRMTVA